VALPAEGEVRARTLATGADILLASGQAQPRGIAATKDDVFFGTETGIARVLPGVPGQTPTTKVVFDDGSVPFPRGAARALALAGTRFVVAHAPSQDGMSGALASYASTGEAISHYTFFSKTIGVAWTPKRTYWSESDGVIRAAPNPILPNGLTPVEVARDILLGDVCGRGDRLYFTAADTDDVRVIRSVYME